MTIQSANPPSIRTLQAWQGLNQQGRRGSIGDDEEWWNENLFSIGPGNLRSCWGHGPAIYTAPAGTQILRMFFGFIGSTTPQFQSPPPGRLGWMFLSNGHVDEVDLDTRIVRHVGPIASIAATTVTGTGTSGTANQLDIFGVTGGTINAGATIMFVNVVDTGTTVVSQIFGPPGGDGRYVFNNEIDLSNAEVQFWELQASGTGTSTGTTSITMTGVTGTIHVGDTASLAGVSDPALVVVNQQSGTPGGDGVYTLSQATSLSAAEVQFFDIGATGIATTASPNTVTITGLSGTLTLGSIVGVGGTDDPNLVVTTQQSGSTGADGIYVLTKPTTFQGAALSFTTGDPYFIWEPIGPQYWACGKVWRPQYFGNVAGQVGGVLFGSPLGLYGWDGTVLSSPGDTAPDWLTDAAETTPEAPPFIMPNGLPGIYAMEVYQNRLWIAGKDVISFSAPSNGADFSTTGGGGSMGYFGDRLVYTFMDLAQSAGYLYVFGDSATDVISNVQLTGQGTATMPYDTAFNYSNLDPQVGHRFPRPVGRMGRHFIQWNGAGIFMTTGGDAQPIGDKVTNTYQTLDTSLYLPTTATATMFGFRVVLLNGRFTDPFGVTRNLLLMWHPVAGRPFWSVASQGLELTHIGYYEQDSIMTPYGTDGTNLYQLFAQPDPNLIKKLSTKAYRGADGTTDALTIKNYKRMYLELHDNSGQGATFTGTMTSGGGGIPGGVEDVGFDLTSGETFDILGVPIQGQGIWGQVDLQSTSPDFTIERLHIAAEERTFFGA